jgi:Icc-related predicted phosphoesterase
MEPNPHSRYIFANLEGDLFKTEHLLSIRPVSSVASVRIFFATDIHGSESCFKKFIYAAKVYKCDTVIMGGDITGKKIIPCIKEAEGLFTVDWLGQHQTIRSQEALEQVKNSVRSVGSYPYEMTEGERAALASDKSRFEALFEEIMRESVAKWVGYAEDKLKGTNVRCFIQPGNDDTFQIDDILSRSERVENPEGRLIELDGGFEMISTGYSNPTPWNCPRDISEEELGVRINEMIHDVRDPSRCVFNFHCPPHDSELDTAPLLDDKLNVIIKQGQMQTAPVGSKAVRAAIEAHGPLLGLHGHIHESRGVFNIGRTTCINPGSEYTEGILRGVIVILEGTRVKSYQFTSG